ncbi:hypothetical protein ACFLFF_32015 [Brevibacillus reuszeri]
MEISQPYWNGVFTGLDCGMKTELSSPSGMFVVLDYYMGIWKT